MNNEIVVLIAGFVRNIVVSVFTIIDDLLMNRHSYKTVKGSHNLKFIKLYFKYFINVDGPGITFKNLQETIINLDGDVVLGVSRFGFGKRKIKHLYVDVKQNTFVILDGE